MMVYTDLVTTKDKQVRRSISISASVDSKVQKIAEQEQRSANQVLEKLIAAGLEAKEAQKRRFDELTERLRRARDEAEIRQIKGELARMTFGG
jgi:predicted transcriptional regulator